MGRAKTTKIMANCIRNNYGTTVSENAARIANLGYWPEYISSTSLTSRVPTETTPAPGFDAGIACCLDLIPRYAQQLSAKLHAAYTPAGVEQVKSEAAEMPYNSDTAWWLAACSVCTEGRVSKEKFEKQVEEFTVLANDGKARRKAAINELAEMKNRFEVKDGVAYSTVDGGMQGAYLSGHEFAVSYAEIEDIYFVGTYLPSLGLETFEFSNELDDLGRSKSGSVHGSKQYVKANNKEELKRVLAAISLEH